MNTFYFRVLTILMLYPYSLLYSQSGWYALNSGTSQHLSSVYFINANTGFVAGGGNSSTRLILKTTDGGVNWLPKYLTSGETLHKIQFVNDNTGYCAGYNNILKSTDSGNNWSVIYSSSYDLYGIYFNDADIGYSVGINNNNSQGVIIKTINGGSSWTPQSTGVGNAGYLFDVYFQTYSIGFVVGQTQSGQNAIILKTTTGGDTWTSQYGGGSTSGMYGISFTSSTNGFTAGLNGKILSSTNSGNNWNEQSSGSNHFYGIFFTTASNGYLVSGAGQILSTTNGGATWALQYQATGNMLGIHFPNSLTGYAVGSSGQLYKTTTGGITGIQQINNNIPNNFSLYQNYPNPFNPSTKIRFALPLNSFTNITLYDALGKEVKTLVNEQLNAGTYEADWEASNYPSGIYFYSLKTNDFTITKKMILIK